MLLSWMNQPITLIWIVSSLADRIIEIRPDGVEDFTGDYEQFWAKKTG